MTELSKTLQAYLEKVVSKVAPDDGPALIADQKERLEDVSTNQVFVSIKDLAQYIVPEFVNWDRIVYLVKKSNSFEDFRERVSRLLHSPQREEWELYYVRAEPLLRRYYALIRSKLGISNDENQLDTSEQ